MPSGFIYVLINPSMPGLAKVGKTTRQPAQRVAELSSATGIASPFLLAFHLPVANCDAAESWVHAQLESNGFRASAQREFFNAPLHEIIEVVSRASRVGADLSDSETINENQEQDQLADQLCELALSHHHGTDVVLKDGAKALKYFEQSAALGNAFAASMAGGYYRWGEHGVRGNLDKAVEFYRISVSLGEWKDYSLIAGIFFDNGQIEAAQKYWVQFFAAACETYGPCRDSNVRMYGVWYCEAVAKSEIEHVVEDATIKHFSTLLAEGVEKAITRLEGETDHGFVQMRRRQLSETMNFIESIAKNSTTNAK